jgi:hypothetical protein
MKESSNAPFFNLWKNGIKIAVESIYGTKTIIFGCIQLHLWICTSVQCDLEERISACTAAESDHDLPVEYYLDTYSSSAGNGPHTYKYNVSVGKTTRTAGTL